MGLERRLADQAATRQSWLDAAVQAWRHDPTVVAAWLWGSEAAGTADVLSDFDLFVILDDECDLAGIDARFADHGEVLWSREVSYNAPEGGRYFTVGYPGPLQPVVIDWYWQPAADAQLGTDTRLLFAKRPLTHAAAPTFALFPNVRDAVPFAQPEDPRERVEGLVVWFWSMFGPLSKKLARRQDDELVEALPMLDGALALAADHIGAEHQPLRDVAGTTSLRLLADRMEALVPALAAAGISDPVPERVHGLDALDTAEALRAEGWGEGTQDGSA